MFDVNLKIAFREAGCPICRIRSQAVARYIFHTLWENVNDVTFRQHFLASEGLCPEHAWQMQNTDSRLWQDGLKTGILYESLLAAVRRQLAHEADTRQQVGHPWWHPARWWPLSSPMVQPQRDACPVCRLGEFEDGFYARQLANKLPEPAWQAAYADSDGLCLAHLRLTLAASDPQTHCWLLAETESRLQALQLDLAEYIRKHAWQFRDEPVSTAERQSWIRAVAWLRGEKLGEE